MLDPDDDPRRDYGCIYDATGDARLLDTLVGRLAKGGEIVLAGFYAEPLTFAFPPAFMKEARLRIAAEWTRDDLIATRALIESRRAVARRPDHPRRPGGGRAGGLSRRPSPIRPA